MRQLRRIATRLDSSLPLRLLVPVVITALFFAVLLGLGVLKKMPADTKVFDVVTLGLAVMAIVFGFIQFLDARRHGRKMEEIASSMSTRYVGGFPKDIDDIVDVAGTADREILVMASFADYGHYSKPDSFERLLEKIHAALSRKVSVKFLVYGDDAAAEALRRRYPAEGFAEERLSPRFEHFFLSYYEGIRKPTTHVEFLGILHRKTREVMSNLFDRGAEIRLLDEQERFFFWIEDDEEVIFSFENGAAHGHPLCFRTRDARLIDTFREIFEQNWGSSLEWSKTFKMSPPVPRQQIVKDAGGASPAVQLITPHAFPPNAAGS